ncbi:MAG: Kae1-associated kinase Bud32 [Candidatus Thorarchaeota archaeon]|nr:Kae1-associated kinase Bud32 [Candidatus Thorarchaeota archaeon]
MKTELWALGAESQILRTTMWGRPVIIKSRVPKPYLLADIDALLRKQRTARECKMLTYARGLGIPTPAVYSVDRSNNAIIMDFIEGRQLKEIAQNAEPSSLRDLCIGFGKMIGLLHKVHVVHGDPTTSNVIVDTRGKLWLVDFGLAEWNATVEMMGVDLHLVQRALETTHWERQELMLEAVLEGYSATMGAEANDVLSRMDAIRERGRYH